MREGHSVSVLTQNDGLKRKAKMRMLDVATLATCAWLVSLPSEAQTGKGLSQADVTANNEVTQAFVKAALAKDWMTVADFYLDDAVLNPPNEPAAKGRAAIKAWMEKLPPLTHFKVTNVKVEGRGDLAYVLGTYTMMTVPLGAPAPVQDSGKLLEVRRRQPDGKWLIAVDIFNSDLQLGPAVGAIAEVVAGLAGGFLEHRAVEQGDGADERRPG